MSEQNKRMTGKLLHKKEKETNNQFKKVCFESNPVSTNAPLLHSLKTSENLRFCDVFRGYISGTLVENGLRKLKLRIYSVANFSIAL